MIDLQLRNQQDQCLITTTRLDTSSVRGLLRIMSELFENEYNQGGPGDPAPPETGSRISGA
jgi:hypothetical protein